MKRCPDCHTHDLSKFGPDRSRRDGYTVYCRACASRRTRLWRHSAAGQASYAFSRVQYAAQYRAREAVKYALRTGALVRPARCQQCGAPGKPHAHHASYAPDQWLVVQWLCRACHRRADTPPLDPSGTFS